MDVSNYKATNSTQDVRQIIKELHKDNDILEDSPSEKSFDFTLFNHNNLSPLFNFFEMEPKKQCEYINFLYKLLDGIDDKFPEDINIYLLNLDFYNELLFIFQNVSSDYIFTTIIKIIYILIQKSDCDDIFFTDELLVPLIVATTQNSDSISIELRDYGFLILIHYTYKEPEHFFEFFSYEKVFPRLINLFIGDHYCTGRQNIVKFLEAICNVVHDIPLENASMLGDLFKFLPDYFDSIFFPDLLNCATKLCEQSPEFAHLFISRIPVGYIFSKLCEMPIFSRFATISMISTFLDTKDLLLYECFMPNFTWNWILPLFLNPDHNIDEYNSTDRIGLTQFATKIFVHCPETANYEHAKDILDNIVLFMNLTKFREKNTILIIISELFFIHNDNIAQLLLDHDYLDTVSQYLYSDTILSKNIIRSIHEIAKYAEYSSNPGIIQAMSDLTIIEKLVEIANSPPTSKEEAKENMGIYELVVNILNDTEIPMFHSFLIPPSGQ
ncbi:hypothetical protein TRFO_41283 [Tritrichomonas foetus]|uniref:Uncharacterized protein n=1 Tax=Tritrichomonas foetus TaxID=1144522 RepID=A0A1J4L531_9EUKA|nr:hypothetical protein TRFO_41283 [Tritrichomonas foetus]|eukprot:OHT17100.1 hypothetical protein TRFO_41283 [Tritrichomonas foetus]